MRIAQIAPLAEAVPPKRYGGTERVVSYLTEELVRQGHEVTLFASGDSRTNARLVSCCPTAVRLDDSVSDPVPHTLMMLDRVRKHADEFDVLHFHTELEHFPVFQDIAPTDGHYVAWTPRCERVEPVLRPVFAVSAGFHFERSAPPDARGQLGGDGLSRPAARVAEVQRSA